MIDKYLEEVNEPIPNNFNVQGWNVNLEKQIMQAQTREILIVLNTILNCAASDLPETIMEIAEEQIKDYHKVKYSK